MSLQVWMPLIKDYENYGLSELKFANFRYIRFVVNAIKGGSDSYTQLSRLEFIDTDGNLYKYPAGTTVSSSMTGYPASEPPASIIDGNVNTKFCASWGGAGAHLTIALGSGETIDISRYSRFQWYTANDADWRDPVSFEVQFSNDGANFVKGAVVTNASITSTRYALAYTGKCFNANAGKIGPSCYYNTSYDTGGLVSNTKINLGNKLSMCCWVKFSSLLSDSALGASMGGQHRYPNCTGMGLTIKYISSSTGYLSCNTGDGSNRTYNAYCGNTLLSAGIWYHVVFTYDGSTIRFYVNGNFDGSYSYTAQKNVEDYVFLGAWSFEHSTDSSTMYGHYKLNGCINDFRIYDHVLSIKEIKELSKGLVAHYQLKGMGATNYLKGAGKFLKDTPLVRNASDVSHMNDSYVYHEWSPNDLFAILPSAGTYTFSAECDGIGSGHQTSGTTASQRLFSLWLQNTSSGNHYHFTMSKGADGRWYGTRTDLVAGTYKVRTNLYAADNVNYTVKFWNMKVTAGSYNPSDTWCPQEEDELYNSLNLGSAVGTDCSGYGNNLERVGTIPITNSSARFGSCVNYNNSGYLRKKDFNLTTNQFTIAFWINPPYSINAQHFICGTFNNWTGNGFGMWRDSTGGEYSALFRSNSEGSYTGLPKFIPSHDTWNHVAYVYNGTKGIYYKNGVEVDHANGGSNGTVYHPVLYLGNSMYNGEPASEIDQASMSDFRFYATALSASDIADLYKNSASLTKDGKLMAYEFQENNRNTIDKDGIVATEGFNDRVCPIYDMSTKVLADGSTWARIHYLDLTNDKTFFANASEVAKCTNKHNRYSRMGDADKFKSQPSLPNGYTELEYLQSSGTQYIDTGIKPNQDTRIVVKANLSTSTSIYGTVESGKLFNMTGGGSGMYYYWSDQDQSVITNYFNQTHVYEQDKNICRVDGNLYHTYTYKTWQATTNIYLFGRNSGSNTLNDAGTVQIYSCQIYDTGNLVRNFVPCKNPSGTIGMYDLVENKFYANAGSGSFSAGTFVSKYEFMLTYPTLSSTEYNRWTQTSSPNATSVTGYTPIHIAWPAHSAGIRKHGSACIYNCDSGDTWYAPIGQTQIWEGGIPAANGNMQLQTELWVRTDKSAEATQTKIYDGTLVASNFIEL